MLLFEATPRPKYNAGVNSFLYVFIVFHIASCNLLLVIFPQVLFSTETFAMGVNAPARTVRLFDFVTNVNPVL